MKSQQSFFRTEEIFFFITKTAAKQIPSQVDNSKKIDRYP